MNPPVNYPYADILLNPMITQEAALPSGIEGRVRATRINIHIL